MASEAFSLAGRAAIVTGAAMGIGRAIATEMAKAGASVACLDLEAAAAKETASMIASAGGRAIAIACDTASETETRAAVEESHRAFGRLDVLAHAAAPREPQGTVETLELASWHLVYGVTVFGAFLLSKHCVPRMRASGGGSILLIASQLGSVAAPSRPAYCSSKGAMIQLAKAMALDHAKDGIRVNSLSPGAVETGRMLHRFGSMEEARKQSGPKHILGRLGQPHEIGTAAVFLASDASSFVTGFDLIVDGGYTAL
jgi:NAD(P)-dependent dehydrogenase (short-subunit alcohol dehydrogenase family)